MPPHESTPLLGDHHVDESDKFNFVKSTRWLVFNSWLNVLLVAVPVCLVAEALHWSAVARFVTSFIAIIPLAKVCWCCPNRE
jgi:Ca2+:H+ antiporter